MDYSQIRKQPQNRVPRTFKIRKIYEQKICRESKWQNFHFYSIPSTCGKTHTRIRRHSPMSPALCATNVANICPCGYQGVRPPYIYLQMSLIFLIFCHYFLLRLVWQGLSSWNEGPGGAVFYALSFIHRWNRLKHQNR